MNDFSQPRHMGPGALAVIFVKTFRSMATILLTVALIDIVSGEEVDSLGAMAARLGISIGVAAALSLLFALADYQSKTFYVSNGKLVFSRGLIKRETLTIPLDRIHSLRTRRGLAYLLFSMRGITIDTLASKGEEIELIISENDWQRLLAHIKREESRKPDAPADVPPEYNPANTMLFSNHDLICDALCQNPLRGIVLLLIFAAGVSDRMLDFGGRGAEMIDNAGNYLDNLQLSMLNLALMLIAAVIAVILLWTGKVFLKNYNLTLTFNNRQLTFSHGLIAQASSRFARNKICTITVKRNFIERRFGYATLQLRQALNATAEKADDNLTIYGRDFSAFFKHWWLGEGYATEPEIMAAGPRRGSLMRLMFPNRISLYNTYFVVYGGRFARRGSYIKYSNIEVVRVRRTPLSPLTGRVALQLSTSGTNFTVRSIPADQAEKLRAKLIK